MHRPRMTAFIRVAFCLTALLAAPPRASALRFERQTLPAHSLLVSVKGDDVRDDAFAKLMRTLLTGEARATFLFQQCFSGGMLDDLERELKTETKERGRVTWVGGSASKHDRVAFGNANPGGSGKGVMPWTKPLIRSLRSDTFRDAIDTAARLDSERGAEEGQGLDAGAGGGRLRDAKVKTHHAILWGGAGEREDLDSIRAMRNLLISVWGPVDPPTVTITVLFHDGKRWEKGHAIPPHWHARPATLPELQKAVRELGVLSAASEEFFFYAADHGNLELGIEIIGRSQPIQNGDAKVWGELVVPQPVLEAITADHENHLLITVRYTGRVAENTVAISLNDADDEKKKITTKETLLGYLDAGSTETQFRIPENALNAHNVLKVRSKNPDKVTIASGHFETGGIAEVTP